VPVAGDDPAYEWAGWVAFDDLPRLEDPPGGFLFSANNRIAAAPDAPYIGIDAAPPSRARRIVDTLTPMTNATLEDMTALHRDVVSLPAKDIVAKLSPAWAPLVGWDFRMAADSTAAAAYSVLRRELMMIALDRSGLIDHVNDPENRVLPAIVAESVVWRVVDQHLRANDTSLLAGWTWEQALSEGVRRAEETWNGETWGELHATGPRHSLARDDFDPPPVPMGGDLDTVMAASYIPTMGFTARAGSVARYAFDLADWDRSGWVIPLGADGEPGAPHSTDQQHAWRVGRLVPAPYTRAAIES